MTKIAYSLSALALLATVACGKSDKATIDTNTIKSSSASDKEKAAQLTAEAEKLLTPLSLPFANKVIDDALSFDASNAKAQFYKKAINPVLKLQGLAKRTESISVNFPQVKKRIDHRLNELPNIRMYEFFTTGVEDILTERDMQNFVLDLYLSLDDLRTHIRDSKDKELELSLPYLLTTYDREALAECTVTAKDGVYVMENCRVNRAQSVRLNRADLETAQHMVAGLQMVEVFLTAYNLEGALKTAKKFKADQVERLNDSEVWNELIKDPSFGRLKDTHKLELFGRLGNEAILGFNWAKRVQEELCPKGKVSTNQRKGHAFPDGLCVNEKVKLPNQNAMAATEFMRLVEVAFSGGFTNLRYYKASSPTAGHDVESKAKFSVLWTRPIEDVQSLNPVFSASGSLQGIADKKAGGVFVNSDVNEIFKNLQRLIIQ